MTIFAVMLPAPAPGLTEAIKRLFPNDHLAISETQYLISAGGTAIDLSAKLGVYDPKEPAKTIGNAVIFATSSYFGRAPTTIWDWIKAKLESPPSA
jgi:hypothetical protein